MSLFLINLAFANVLFTVSWIILILIFYETPNLLEHNLYYQTLIRGLTWQGKPTMPSVWKADRDISGSHLSGPNESQMAR